MFVKMQTKFHERKQQIDGLVRVIVWAHCDFNMDNIEYKSLEFKAEDIRREGEHLYVKAYASTFGHEDSYNDIVVKGAFINSISGDNGRRVKLCYQHDIKDVRGKIIDIAEDDKGLFVEFRTSRTTKGKDLAIQIEDGELFELSIGYITLESDEINGIRYLKEVDLIEISIVSRAANSQASVISSERKSEFTAHSIKAMPDKDLSELYAITKEEYYTRIIKHL